MVREATAARYIDREPDAVRRIDRGIDAGAATRWRHPQAREGRSDAQPGDRYVDHDFFDDRPDETAGGRMRRGARVKHDRFGEGKVLSVVSVGEPAVVAFFPGWGEKKILARFLKLA